MYRGEIIYVVMYIAPSPLHDSYTVKSYKLSLENVREENTFSPTHEKKTG